MFEVNKAITDVYIKMGNLSKSQVDLSVVIARLFSVINKKMVEYNLSTTNWIISFVDVYATGEYRNALPVSDFSNAVSVEIDGNGDFTNYGREVDIINPLNVNLSHQDGKRSIGFYQNENENNWYYVTSFKDFDGAMRIWYEPDSPAPASITGSVNIKRFFMDLVTSETAYHTINYAKGLDIGNREAIKASLREDYLNWQDLWQEELQKGRQQKTVRRTPFRAGF